MIEYKKYPVRKFEKNMNIHGGQHKQKTKIIMCDFTNAHTLVTYFSLVRINNTKYVADVEKNQSLQA